MGAAWSESSPQCMASRQNFAFRICLKSKGVFRLGASSQPPKAKADGGLINRRGTPNRTDAGKELTAGNSSIHGAIGMVQRCNGQKRSPRPLYGVQAAFGLLGCSLVLGLSQFP